MATHKHIDAICIVIVLFTLLLTGLFMNGKALGVAVIADEENSGEMFTENDQNAAWDTSDATRIILSDGGSTVNGNGAYANGSTVYIVYAGTYVVSGELTNGKIVIEADGDDQIWLMLDGISVHCEDDAAIRVEQAGKVFLTLQDGTENTLSSGSAYSTEAVSANVDGTIYSRDDLTINGGGSLSITAKYQHGIVCNDDLVITGGHITVTAAQDGLHANDSVRIREADVTITAGDDGITASNDDETAYLYIESGNISIPSCYEGLEAIQVTVAGGTLAIFPTDDGINANGSGGSSAIYITGGEITITNENGIDADGLDSNGSIFISGGKLLVSVSDSGGSSAIDYGSEYGGVCEVNGGVVLACGSSAMAEGFSASSTQGFLIYHTTAEARTSVTVKDADGNELLNETAACSFSSIAVSAPGMEIGDTCTLSIGETETELTIDNVSNSGGFGGNRPAGRGGFGMSDESYGDQTPNQGNAQNSGEQQNGTPPTDFPSTGSSEIQAENGTKPPRLSDGQGGINGEDVSSDFPHRDESFGERPDNGDAQMPNGRNMGNIPNQENAANLADAEAPISGEGWMLLGISAIVLLIGCVVAGFYRRRG